MVAQAQFSTAGAMVQPGETETLTLTLFNIGNHTETYTLVPAGLLAGWVRLDPPTVTLFGGTNQTIDVTIRPPKLPTTPAGPAPLTVRIIPLDDPDDVIIAETTAIIGSFHERHIRLLQPVVRSRRRAVYEFLVQNSGNSQASCRLHLIDTSQRLDGDFNPAAVGVEPGGDSLVRLRMKALRRQWTRSPRIIPFSIEADQQGFPTASANATFVQSSMMPERLGRRIAALILLLGALAGAWFGVIKPATKRAAEDAIRDQPVVVVTTTTPTTSAVTVPVSTNPGDTAPPVTVPPVTTETSSTQTAAPLEEGALFSQRIVVDAAPKASNQQDYAVPAGQELRVTDLIVQNVGSSDSGLATVLKGDEVIAQWDLSLVYPNNEPLTFFSPYVFEAGSTLTFKLECDSPGKSGQCTEGLIITGRLVTL
jgi:hypothetical protein